MLGLIGKNTQREKLIAGFKNSLWGIGIIAILLSIRSLGTFRFLEFMILDQFIASRIIFPWNKISSETPDEEITIIEIDAPYVETFINQDFAIQSDSLARLLDDIYEYNPKVVGTHIVSYRIIGPDQKKLLNTLNKHSNLITVDSDAQSADPIEGLSKEQVENQVGFNDLIEDQDGFVRRALLGFSPTRGPADYKKSFAIQIVDKYFRSNKGPLEERIQKLKYEQEKINPTSTENYKERYKKYEEDIKISYQELESSELNNGIRDTKTMRFGKVEIPRINRFYGYKSKQEYGVQTLINYRGNTNPFQIIKASELENNEVLKNNSIFNKIILLALPDTTSGIVSPLTRASQGSLIESERLTGTEVQAHIISQLIQAVETDRPLIWTNQLTQYIFFIVFSVAGISIGRTSKNTVNSLFLLSFLIFSGILFSYLTFIVTGLWLPLAATLVSTTANGLIYINYTQNKRRWERLIEQLDVALDKEKHLSQKLIRERQTASEDIFDSIHNGPLQTLASLLRRTRDETISLYEVRLNLEDLDREIRYIGDSIRQDTIDETHSLELSYTGTKLDLSIPLQELFQGVYDATLSRPLLGFSNLKIKAISFEPIESEALNKDIKRKLCRFLEEALSNVGKHALGATRLTVTGKMKGDIYELTITDNGLGFNKEILSAGNGTVIGKETAKLIQGSFTRKENKPKGFFCQLSFPVNN